MFCKKQCKLKRSCNGKKVNNYRGIRYYVQSFIQSTFCNVFFIFKIRFFNIEGIAPDTLTLRYEAVPYFHSEECGAMYIFNISEFKVTHNFIDSVAVPNKVINNEDRISIKLFI